MTAHMSAHHLVHNVENWASSEKLSENFIRIGEMMAVESAAAEIVRPAAILHAANALTIINGSFVTIGQDFVGFGNF